MQIGIPTETRPGEQRVAATPETVKRLTSKDLHRVSVQAGAGLHASVSDAAYQSAGAAIVPSAAALYGQAELVLKVRAPDAAALAHMRRGTVFIGMLGADADVAGYVHRGLTAFALERMPRSTRAQEMDVLSSQANIAGYKAVILAADLYRRFFPMLMTAAGTVRPARVLVLGAGVAGLQAVATARRLGAVVEVFDVRAAVKEQVESLGAKFVEVPGEAQGEAAGGYAREMSGEYQRRQAELIQQRAVQADIVITTALIPGRSAPRLVSEETVRSMKPGSVIVDLAAETGGNCALTEPDKIVEKHGVTLVGLSNLPSLVAADASALYARNLLNFVNLLIDTNTGALTINRDDEIVAATLLCQAGERVGGAVAR